MLVSGGGTSGCRTVELETCCLCFGASGRKTYLQGHVERKRPQSQHLSSLRSHKKRQRFLLKSGRQHCLCDALQYPDRGLLVCSPLRNCSALRSGPTCSSAQFMVVLCIVTCACFCKVSVVEGDLKAANPPLQAGPS